MATWMIIGSIYLIGAGFAGKLLIDEGGNSNAILLGMILWPIVLLIWIGVIIYNIFFD